MDTGDDTDDAEQHQSLNPSMPLTLLNRLNQDLAHALTDSTPADPTPMLQYANSKLLSMTPKALGCLDRHMNSSDPKISLSAATQTLDRSPATRTLTLNRDSAPTLSLPASAIAELLRGLGTFLGGSGSLRSPSPEPQEPLPSAPEPMLHFSPSAASMPLNLQALPSQGVYLGKPPLPEPA